MFIDTHCHLTDGRFASAADVVKDLKAASVDYVIDIGYDIRSSEGARDNAAAFENVFFAAGIHPENAEQASEKGLEIIVGLCKDPRCVAVGEIGLDYHYDGYDKEMQKRAFEVQIELAEELQLPISVHSRDCTEDMLKILKNNRGKFTYGGVMHCYAGSVETARELLDLGFYISFAGTVTFKNAVNVQNAAKFVPPDRILTETDSPYLAPHPLRGTVNSPANVGLIAQKIAELRAVDVLAVAERVRLNAQALFKIKV